MFPSVNSDCCFIFDTRRCGAAAVQAARREAADARDDGGAPDRLPKSRGEAGGRCRLDESRPRGEGAVEATLLSFIEATCGGAVGKGAYRRGSVPPAMDDGMCTSRLCDIMGLCMSVLQLGQFIPQHFEMVGLERGRGGGVVVSQP